MIGGLHLEMQHACLGDALRLGDVQRRRWRQGRRSRRRRASRPGSSSVHPMPLAGLGEGLRREKCVQVEHRRRPHQDRAPVGRWRGRSKSVPKAAVIVVLGVDASRRPSPSDTPSRPRTERPASASAPRAAPCVKRPDCDAGTIIFCQRALRAGHHGVEIRADDPGRRCRSAAPSAGRRSTAARTRSRRR